MPVQKTEVGENEDPRKELTKFSLCFPFVFSVLTSISRRLRMRTLCLTTAESCDATLGIAVRKKKSFLIASDRL